MKKSELRKMIREELLNEESPQLKQVLTDMIHKVIQRYAKNPRLKNYNLEASAAIAHILSAVDSDDLAVGQFFMAMNNLRKKIAGGEEPEETK